ncbi:hypothetical protein [Methanothermobacter sp. K4]|uniref:hypothetical protein n=1 Tax=Methanothermobacter sp. K4 TaxID=2913262 RepID=UPI001EDA132C|nr:hypothetical protein [Methanothermobacter sp. K4]MCG2828107.1 hypothetical protein [Methanothermobacter sp. K4]
MHRKVFILLLAAFFVAAFSSTASGAAVNDRTGQSYDTIQEHWMTADLAIV